MNSTELSGFQPFAQICDLRKRWLRSGKRVVLTNGCFDLMHPGHIFLLEQAASFGDRLLVALNSDESVRQLKGNERPIIPQNLRAYAISSLRFVHGVFIFDGTRVVDEIRALAPDVYVRAADRRLVDLNSKELCALRDVGTAIEFVPFLDGFSTTAIVARIRSWIPRS